jgi:hypothetical protein
MGRLYDADDYFKRFAALYIESDFPLGRAKTDWLKKNRPLTYAVQHVFIALGAIRILSRVWSDPRTRPFRPVYARYLREMLRHRRPLRHVFQFAARCAMHTHFALMTGQMTKGERHLVNT